MRAQILTIGDEILAGDIQDTNFRELAQVFRGLGLLVTGHVTVPDQVDLIAEAVRRAASEAEIVFLTGGLGPTPDDLTRAGVAKALGVAQVRREDLVPRLEEIFRKYAPRKIPQINYTQLDLPEGAEPLINGIGTAPGFRVAHGDALVFAVPGIPREMRLMLENEILPWMKENLDLPDIETRVFRTIGLGESALVEMLEGTMDQWRGVGVAFYPQMPGVDVKLTHHGKDARRMERELDRAESDIRRILRDHIYATGTQSLAAALGEALVQRSQSLAIAESCTGGAIAAMITAVPGASRYFLEGAVTYSNQAKVRVLGVPERLLEEHGAVSEPVARAMAEGLRARSGADFALATTGIAGPGGGTEDKPVGLVHMALAHARGTEAWSHTGTGTRAMIIARTSRTALDRVRRAILAGD
ncbi:MAG: CinA family nicotinamide mononucleotide deamidase-related protein [Candidatus Eisenbacteria bacterium]|uniref:CinA-like protein n=1 Tax=Eiseniibacteriota bacterium TaxID=2212470 RepID=A0A7Y2H378_UNCEI|nr:CinA family nicotinamide mononucleotide deamidase-related protein [Candidatus Eisenbacteria bacterium]